MKRFYRLQECYSSLELDEKPLTNAVHHEVGRYYQTLNNTCFTKETPFSMVCTWKMELFVVSDRTFSFVVFLPFYRFLFTQINLLNNLPCGFGLQTLAWTFNWLIFSFWLWHVLCRECFNSWFLFSSKLFDYDFFRSWNFFSWRPCFLIIHLMLTTNWSHLKTHEGLNWTL